jgi:hypothetical protein
MTGHSQWVIVPRCMRSGVYYRETHSTICNSRTQKSAREEEAKRKKHRRVLSSLEKHRVYIFNWRVPLTDLKPSKFDGDPLKLSCNVGVVKREMRERCFFFNLFICICSPLLWRTFVFCHFWINQTHIMTRVNKQDDNGIYKWTKSNSKRVSFCVWRL